MVKKLNIWLDVLLVPHLKPISFPAETLGGCSKHGTLVLGSISLGPILHQAKSLLPNSGIFGGNIAGWEAEPPTLVRELNMSYFLR